MMPAFGVTNQEGRNFVSTATNKNWKVMQLVLIANYVEYIVTN